MKLSFLLAIGSLNKAMAIEGGYGICMSRQLAHEPRRLEAVLDDQGLYQDEKRL